MEAFIIFFIMGIFGIAWIISKLKGTDPSSSNFAGHSYYHPSPSERLPNGYTRSDYHDYGLSDADIDCWGLDQPDAPEPAAAGWAIMDMLDGDFDGDIDF